MAKPIISLIVIFLSIGFTFFYVIPAYELNVARRGDVESLAKILNTSEEIKTLIGETKENLNSIDTAVLSRFEVFLPEKIDPIRFANNIQNIGRKNRIIFSELAVESPEDASQKAVYSDGSNRAVQGLVNTISLGSKISQAGGGGTDVFSDRGGIPGKKYVTTKATFSFTTTYETFQLFLNDLERSLGVINVTSLSFSPVPADASDASKKNKTVLAATYQFSMSIETYSLK